MRAQEFVAEFWKRKPKDQGRAHRDGIDLEIFGDGDELQINADAHEIGRAHV